MVVQRSRIMLENGKHWLNVKKDQNQSNQKSRWSRAEVQFGWEPDDKQIDNKGKTEGIVRHRRGDTEMDREQEKGVIGRKYLGSHWLNCAFKYIDWDNQLP